MSLILKVGLAICPGNRPQKKSKKLKFIDQRMVLASRMTDVFRAANTTSL
ncbi:hypothetical protein [Comamonas terrigena]|nr:hypothetical protein [Comamonas terrigena]